MDNKHKNDKITIRKEAIESSTQAVCHDNDGDFEEAIKLYTNAVEKLNLLSKIDDNKYNAEIYHKKANEYSERISVLKKGGGVKHYEKLNDRLGSFIQTEIHKVKLSDVAGLVKAKEILEEAINLPIKFPQLYVGKRKPWKTILLYGVRYYLIIIFNRQLVLVKPI